MLRKGDRVRPTPKARQQGAVTENYREGVCISDERVSPRGPNQVSIKWDHLKTPMPHAPDQLEKITWRLEI